MAEVDPITTIKVHRSTRDRLKAAGTNMTDTYDSVIAAALDALEKARGRKR